MLSINLVSSVNDCASVAKSYAYCKVNYVDKVDTEINLVIPHLHEGEKAKVYFKSGRIAIVTVFPTTKLSNQ